MRERRDTVSLTWTGEIIIPSRTGSATASDFHSLFNPLFNFAFGMFLLFLLLTYAPIRKDRLFDLSELRTGVHTGGG